ncbi:hypothetical protein BV22DRAFT_894371 [Leucogyrophana mollusca]|uniref:Uncharacterized protein n=1 Tax=Leucogyrophana mollusca TaxID=85980 RepID=A0ACB8B2D0_9AGAM|nr:hypothetical protein BV22DRAFT_894371 [Leucogyrophana mollusca]
MGPSPSLTDTFTVPSRAFICHIHALSVHFPTHSDAVSTDRSPKRILRYRFCGLRYRYSCLPTPTHSADTGNCASTIPRALCIFIPGNRRKDLFDRVANWIDVYGFDSPILPSHYRRDVD